MPGWSAAIDGHARAVREYGGVFQAVTVGPGTHRVTFGFTPPHLSWALLAFATGFLWLLGAPLVTRRQKQDPRQLLSTGRNAAKRSQPEQTIRNEPAAPSASAAVRFSRVLLGK